MLAAMRYQHAESSFDAAVVTVQADGGDEVKEVGHTTDFPPTTRDLVRVQAVAPNGLVVVFEAFEDEYGVGDIVGVTVTRSS
ncbi:MAG: hypothetical protein ACR2MB_05540 [Acidimicrobiales bacterium]